MTLVRRDGDDGKSWCFCLTRFKHVPLHQSLPKFSFRLKIMRFMCFLFSLQLNRLKPKVREFLKQSKDDNVYMSLGQLALSLTKEDISKMPVNAFR